MKAAGIVAEYNPFHQGHVFHLQQTREVLQPDVLVVVVSEWFSQRGLPSLMTPQDKARLALEHGANLVIGLPACYAAQSADHFARYALEALKQAGVQTICFGSETGDLAWLQKARKQLEDLPKDPSRSQMRNIQSVLPGIGPNDVLGIQYLRWCEKLGLDAVCIQRESRFASATASRASFFDGQRVWLDSLFLKKASWEHLYPFLRMQLLMSSAEQLQQIFLVQEGIENLLIAQARRCADWQSFLEGCQNKSYSRARIQRTCLFILLQQSSFQMKGHASFFEVIVLGADDTGRRWLRHLQKQAAAREEESHIYSAWRQLPEWLKVQQQKPRQIMEILTGKTFSPQSVQLTKDRLPDCKRKENAS